MRWLALCLVLGGCLDLDRYAPVHALGFDPLLLREPSEPMATSAFAFVDLDGDGTDDLVYGLGDGSIAVRRGERSGGTIALRPAVHGDPDGSLGVAKHLLLPIDLDGDGRPEVVSPGVDAWRWQDGQPVRLGAYAPADPAQGASDRRGVVADVDGDGVPELWSLTTDGFDVARWDGAHLVSIGGGPRGLIAANLAVADLDGDGAPDALLYPDGDADQQVRVLWGGASAPWTSPAFTGCKDPRGRMYTLTVADLDDDGRPDLVAYMGDDHLFWCRGLGGRSFDKPRLVDTIAAAATRGDPVLISGDFDRDRHADLFVQDGAMYLDLHGYRGTALVDGPLAPLDPPIALPPSTVGSSPPQVIARDLDDDGRLDLVVWGADGLSWVRNVSR